MAVKDRIVYTHKLPGLPIIPVVEVGPGMLVWNTPGFHWMYNERMSPPHANVAMQVDGRWDYQLRVDQLEAALYYTMGMAFGYKNGFVIGKTEAEAASAMVKTVFADELEKDKQRPQARADSGLMGDSQ